MNTARRTLPTSVDERFTAAFEWHRRLCLSCQPTLPVIDWLFEAWYADDENKQMYDEIVAIFLKHAVMQVQSGADRDDWITLADVPKLTRELTLLLRRHLLMINN